MELRIIVVGLGYGAGNPGADNGTGGLLIMCANSIKNNGIISSNGTSGGTGSLSSGGSSGGGSINIFYKEKKIKKTFIVMEELVQIRGIMAQNGGNGGNGCITIGNISTGTFVKDE